MCVEDQVNVDGLPTVTVEGANTPVITGTTGVGLGRGGAVTVTGKVKSLTNPVGLVAFIFILYCAGVMGAVAVTCPLSVLDATSLPATLKLGADSDNLVVSDESHEIIVDCPGFIMSAAAAVGAVFKLTTG
jgi:hypothetical protein